MSAVDLGSVQRVNRRTQHLNLHGVQPRSKILEKTNSKDEDSRGSISGLAGVRRNGSGNMEDKTIQERREEFIKLKSRRSSIAACNPAAAVSCWFQLYSISIFFQ